VLLTLCETEVFFTRVSPILKILLIYKKKNTKDEIHMCELIANIKVTFLDF